MFKKSSSNLHIILPAAVMAASRYCSVRHVLLTCVILFNCFSVAAQIAMPDSVCLGETKHYNVDYNSFVGSTYTWKIDGVVQTSSVTNGIDITWNTLGTFLLSVQEKNINGCLGPLRSGLVYVTKPVAIAYSNSPVCEGSSINLRAETLENGLYRWTGPNGFTSSMQNPVINFATKDNAGIYTLVVSTKCNCCHSEPTSITVVVNNCNTADLSVLNTVNNEHPFIGRNVEFTVKATNNSPDNATGVIVSDYLPDSYTYVSSTVSTGSYDNQTGEWNIGTMISGESETLTIIATVNPTGTYATTAIIDGIEEDSNLENNVSSNITYPSDFFIPDAFSPNGDGINDQFVIRGIVNYPLNKFLIYNRWGNKVFEASPYHNTWDGKSMFGIVAGGNELPTGTYFYLLDLGNDIDILKGTIYLNR